MDQNRVYKLVLIYLGMEIDENLAEAFGIHAGDGYMRTRERNKGELDGFQWYCDSCEFLIYEKFIQLTDIVTQLPPLFDEYWRYDKNRTCRKCGEIQQPPEKS